jgi:hypothetical protein
MGGKLHELLAVEGDLEGAFKKILKESVVTFEKKGEHFIGMDKTLQMFDDARAHEEDAYREVKALVTTAQAKLDYTTDYGVRYLDAVLQKERTNQEAKADIEIDGTVIASDLPATFLLGLETRLKWVRELYEKVPTHTPGIEWIPDADMGAGVFRTKEPRHRHKTEKTMKHKVLYDATEEHPAQLETWSEDIPIGKFTETLWSGMLSPAEKSAKLGRIDKLLRAVKKARQRANAVDVVDVTIGKELFNYIEGK